MRKQVRWGVLAVCLMGIASYSFAVDLVKPLKGVYRGTIHIDCQESQAGFTPLPDQRFVQNTPYTYANSYSDSYVSTAVFPGDGTMTETLRGTTLFGGSIYDGALAAGTFVSTCTYRLTMNLNKSFTWKGRCEGVIPTGPAYNQSSTVEDIDGQGQVSDDGSLIIIGATQPDENTLILSGGYSAQRLCAATGTYIRVRY